VLLFGLVAREAGYSDEALVEDHDGHTSREVAVIQRGICQKIFRRGESAGAADRDGKSRV
jgi:hypothetical protein